MQTDPESHAINLSEGPLANRKYQGESNYTDFDAMFYGFDADNLRNIALVPADDIVEPNEKRTTLVDDFPHIQPGRSDNGWPP